MEKKKKMSVKELIQAGAFDAIFVVVFVIIGVVCGITPVTFAFAGMIAAVILGPVYVLYALKVQRRWTIFILSIFLGLVSSSSFIYPLIISVILGMIAELILGERSTMTKARIMISHAVFACMYSGPIMGILFAKDKFLTSTASYYGDEYVEKFSKIFENPWIYVILIGGSLLLGIGGALFGELLLKKHFKKAGIV